MARSGQLTFELSMAYMSCYGARPVYSVSIAAPTLWLHVLRGIISLCLPKLLL